MEHPFSSLDKVTADAPETARPSPPKKEEGVR
jgi:hypothetical protein